MEKKNCEREYNNILIVDIVGCSSSGGRDKETSWKW